MKVSVVTRSGRELVRGGLELNDSATVTDLQEAIHKRSLDISNLLVTLNLQTVLALVS
ncbi:hypothetical protein OROMI_031053 [Orobanche minor]